MRVQLKGKRKGKSGLVRFTVMAACFLFLAAGLSFGQMVMQDKKMLKTPSLRLGGDLSIKFIRCNQKSVKAGGTIGGLKIFAKSTFGLALREIAADLILTRRAAYPAPAPYAVYAANYSDNVLLKGGRTHVSFGPGSKVEINFGTNNQIPADTPPGNYYLGVVIDTGNKARETNERNNVAWCKIRVGKGNVSVLETTRPIGEIAVIKKAPDLVVPSVKFKRVKKGKDSQGNPYFIFNVIITVKNIGNAVEFIAAEL